MISKRGAQSQEHLLDDNLIAFLQSRRAEGLSESTVHWYIFIFRRFQFWLQDEGLTIETVKPLNFQAFIASLRESYAPATVRQAYGGIRTLYKWLVDLEMVDKDPTAKLKRPKEEDYFPTIVARDYIEHMLDSIELGCWTDWRDKIAIELMFCTGLRSGEVAALCVNDVDMANRSLSVRGKGRKERTVFFPDDFAPRLEEWIHKHRPTNHKWPTLFLTSKHGSVRGPLGQQTLYIILRNRAAKAAIEWKSPHAYRHGFAVDMLKNGASTRLIQKLLGHSNIGTTEKYLKIVPDEVKEMYGDIWNANPLAQQTEGEQDD